MALWIPYVQEVALDLSKSSSVKVERVSTTVTLEEPHTSMQRHLYIPQPGQDVNLLQRDTQPFQDPKFYEGYQDIKTQLSTGTPHYEEYRYQGYGYQPAVSYDVLSMLPDSTVNTNAAKHSPSLSHLPDGFDVESVLDDPEYQAFERDAFQAMAEKNGGTLLENNPRMRRAVQSSQASDDTYRKKRERNNYAAKQSRDRRKLKEMRLALQVTFLKKKMVELKARRATGLCRRCIVYKYP